MKKSFSWRVFISFGLFVAFFMMLVSGTVLYVSPPGRVANWSDWRMIGLTKRAWQNQHLIFGFAFAILSLCHLFLVNWRAFLSYLKGKAAQGIRSPVELATVIILSCFFGLGTYYGMQPFSAITAFGDRISGSWENRGRQAPVPHAELMTLDELSRQPGLGVDAAVLLEKLRKAGLKVGSQQETLARIAEKNGMTAEKVYEIIAPEGKHEKSLGGAGFGRRTIRQIADDAGVSAASLQLALRQKGIDAQIDTPLRDVAADNHMGTSKN